MEGCTYVLKYAIFGVSLNACKFVLSMSILFRHEQRHVQESIYQIPQFFLNTAVRSFICRACSNFRTRARAPQVHWHIEVHVLDM